MSIWKKAAAFFGMPEATEAEVDARLDQELTSAEAADTEEVQGADAGAEEADEAVDTPAASEAAAEETDAIGDLQAQLESAAQTISQLGAEVQALTTRIANLEGSDAAEETGGATEAAEMAAPEEAPWMSNPINQKFKRK